MAWEDGVKFLGEKNLRNICKWLEKRNRLKKEKRGQERSVWQEVYIWTYHVWTEIITAVLENSVT